jgi:chemotaxis protein MotB
MKLDFEPEEPASGVPPWSVTFSDMALNMLCIFALMLSFSHYKASEFQEVAGSMRAAFGAKPASGLAAPQAVTSARSASGAAPASTPSEARVDVTSAAEVERYIETRGLAAVIDVEDTPRGVVIRVRDQALFESGSATLRDAGQPLLLAVADLCRQFPGTLAVEGHSDDRPISTLQFPSNWELSAGRAAAVLRSLVASGVDSAGVHVAGYADLHPIAANTDESGRARNRRVEFVFEPRTRDH